MNASVMLLDHYTCACLAICACQSAPCLAICACQSAWQYELLPAHTIYQKNAKAFYLHSELTCTESVSWKENSHSSTLLCSHNQAFPLQSLKIKIKDLGLNPSECIFKSGSERSKKGQANTAPLEIIMQGMSSFSLQASHNQLKLLEVLI